MACPWFHPRTKLREGRAPLGAIYDGLCEAAPESPIDPDLCNFGYARGRCEHFAETTPTDAVRFAVRGADVIFVLERDHSPVTHGLIDCAADRVKLQASVFLDNLQRWKQAPQ